MSNSIQSQLHVDDYLIADINSKEGAKAKYRLFKVTSLKPLLARYEVLAHIKRQIVELQEDKVLLNLGPSPQPGSVYGVKIRNLYRKTSEHPKFGAIHFMCKPTKQDMKSLSDGMNGVHASLKKAGLLFLLQEDTVLEATDATAAKYAGCFRYSKDRSKLPSRLEVCVNSNSLKKIGVDSYEYVLAHELGHALHFHHVNQSPELNSKWIRAYKTSVAPKRIDTEVAQTLLDACKTEGSIRGAIGTIEEDNTQSAKLILKWIRTFRGISTKELDILIETGKHEILDQIWPLKESLSLRENKPLITLYATKNYRELFAEVFAFYITGKKVPEKLVKLMQESITYSKSGNATENV